MYSCKEEKHYMYFYYTKYNRDKVYILSLHYCERTGGTETERLLFWSNKVSSNKSLDITEKSLTLYYFQGDMTEECLGQAQVPTVQTAAQGSEADIQSLSDDLFKFARHNFPNTVVTQVTKESAKQFKENSFPASRSSLSFHLQSVVANFVSWNRTDPRVSKEVFKCKILPSAVSSCFSIQRTKTDARQSQRMIISF